MTLQRQRANRSIRSDNVKAAASDLGKVAAGAGAAFAGLVGISTRNKTALAAAGGLAGTAAGLSAKAKSLDARARGTNARAAAIDGIISKANGGSAALGMRGKVAGDSGATLMRKPSLTLKDRAQIAASAVKSVPSRIAEAERQLEVGVAKQVGYAALDAKGASNAVTRAGVDAAASVAPRATAAVGLNEIGKAKPKQFNEAMLGAAGRARNALEPHVQPFFSAIDRAEAKVGDKLQAATGVRNPIAAAIKGTEKAVSKVGDMAKSLRTPRADRPPAVQNAPLAKQDAPVASAKGDGTTKQAADKGGDSSTYTTTDGRTVEGTTAQQAAWKARRKAGGGNS